MKALITFFLLIFILSLKVFSQHLPLYSSYLFNGLVINPALAGNANALSLSLNYRNQWAGAGVENSPQTLTFCAHSPLLNKAISTGVIVTNDQLGVSNNTEFVNAYAYRFRIKDVKISIGAQIGYTLIRNDWSKVKLTDANDYAYLANSQTVGMPKIGVGVHVSTKLFYVGASMPSVPIGKTNDGNNIVSLYTNQSFFYTGFNIQLHENVVLKPSVYLRYLANSKPQADINVLATFYDKFNVGVSYRSSDALVFLALYNVTRQLSIGYSYDHIVSSLNGSLRGNHELLLRYDFKYFVKDINPKSFK